MIRFCDREIYWIEYCAISNEDTVNKTELLQYFLDGHQDDVVCVYDDDSVKRFKGIITYQSLNRFLTVCEAIRTEYLVLDENIWKNAREYCKRHPRSGTEYLIPVLDKDNQLYCFAYEDLDANRELRILRELQEKPEVMQFSDIYPDCQCVKIHEFNELAYFFAKYLRTQNIAVLTEGCMWESFFVPDYRGEVLDYKCMIIYAEGVWERPANWVENLLRSVSVEFECIDHIYEENIKAGMIGDTDRTHENLMDYLKEADKVVILGTDAKAQDAYDYLKGKGVEVCCFVEDRTVEIGRRLFNRPVIRMPEAMDRYGRAVFVDNHEKGSAWGMGWTDYFDYLGYGRNRDFFLLKDYVEICGNSLKNALKGEKVVLAGDVYLCERLAAYFEEAGVFEQNELEYIVMQDVCPVEGGTCLNIANMEELKKGALCLVAMPEYFQPDLRDEQEKRKAKITSYLRIYGILDYTDYFSSMEAFIDIEKEIKCKYQPECLYPKRVILGSINSSSGSAFVKGLLDAHPSIMIMYSNLNNNLFWFCVRLSVRKANEIPSLFLQWYQSEWKGRLGLDDIDAFDVDVFMEKMCKLLKKRDIWTSQGLFMIFHIAYMYMCGTDIDNAEDMVIYWEPHHLKRSVMEDCVKWLGTKTVSCDIINVVRNTCMRNGSKIKQILKGNWSMVGCICQVAIEDDYFERKDYGNSSRLVVRFEDLKCRPEEELHRICLEWGIPWSESLMHTTFHGEERKYNNGAKFIKDFDLTPVYDTYEEYFSEFDRFKITLICMPWQKMYGYPYVDITLFSRRELQEMFLKKFRFMDKLSVETERQRLVYNVGAQNYVRERLQRIRMLSMKNDE